MTKRQLRVRAVIGVIVFITLLPAIEIDGLPARHIDPSWIEGISTFWALIGAAAVVSIELWRDRRDEQREQERFLVEIASVFTTWRLTPAAIGQDESQGHNNYYQIVVNNYGRYPVTDVLVEFTTFLDEVEKIKSPFPIGPGGHQVMDSFPRMISDIDFVTSFTALGNGRRYRREPDGKLTPL